MKLYRAASFSLLFSILMFPAAAEEITQTKIPEKEVVKMREKIYSWGYVLDKVPTAAPFIFGKTRCSLETATKYLGAGKTFYMNSMFNPDYIRKYFPETEQDCFDNCIDNRLSDAHMKLLADIPEVYCTLEHGGREKSARKIAELSLKYKNIKGINLDDFNNGGPDTAMTPEELKQLRTLIRSINPELKIAIVTYSHFPVDQQIAPFAEYVDIVSRWCWVASQDYWDNYEKDIKAVRKALGPNKKIIQGIYIHDFGSNMKCQYPVPLEVFKKSIRTICRASYDGLIDGFIIPQAGWFSAETHYEHISWMKNYLTWFEETTTSR